ncbi:hypothetical protein J3R30DRAFT_3425922 [Lentinula aciculospora]|uniref:Uncharacterized protein n=1 Tax=Lentinula aciculospora TaxID=153920 RepID=A0A9W9AUF6_9AGAR|nr:hypothetical protein J3R30DRAFT_3425922 [Lentinula aciculospora]
MRNNNPTAAFSGFQFQFIGKKSQSDSESSLLKRMSSTNASGSQDSEYDEDSARSQDIDMAEHSDIVPAAVETENLAAFSAVPSRRTLLQTLGKQQQTTPIPGPKVDIFGQKFAFSFPSSSSHLASSTTPSMNATQPAIAGTISCVDNTKGNGPSSSASTTSPSLDFSSTVQTMISRASSCASNLSTNLTYPYDNTISISQSTQRSHSPLVVKAESSRASMPALSKNSSSLSTQDSTSSSMSSSIQTSSSPSFAALKEIHSNLLSTSAVSRSEKSESIEQVYTKLASAFECASRAQNLAQESFTLAQTASLTLVNSVKAGKDSRETADQARSLVEASMEILAVYKAKQARDIAETNKFTKEIGGWIFEQEKRMKLANETKERERKENQVREKKEREEREALEREVIKVTQEKDALKKKEKEEKEKLAKEAQEKERVAREEEAKKKKHQIVQGSGSTSNNVIIGGPLNPIVHGLPSSRTSPTFSDPTTSSSPNSSITFDIDGSIPAADVLDTLDKADAWIEKLKTIENAARRAREEKELQRDRVLEDQKRKEEEAQAEESRRHAFVEQERQKLMIEQKENERRQKKQTAEEHRRNLAMEEEERAQRDAQKKKAIEERDLKLRARLKQEHAQAQKQVAIEEPRQRNVLQQSQANIRKLSATSNPTGSSQRPTPFCNITVPSVSNVPSTQLSSPSSSTSPLPAKILSPNPQSTIPTIPNVIANQTVAKLSKKQRRQARQVEALAQQQQQTLSGSVSIGATVPPASTIINVAPQNAAGGQNTSTPSSTLSSSYPTTSASASNHSPVNAPYYLELHDRGVSNSSSSPILHTNSVDTGNLLLQISEPRFPEIHAANMRFVTGARAALRQQVAIPNPNPISNVIPQERKEAVKKSRPPPEYDTPVVKDEDEERNSVQYLHSPAKSIQNTTTLSVVPSSTSDLPTVPSSAGTNTQARAPLLDPRKPLAAESIIEASAFPAPPASVSKAAPDPKVSSSSSSSHIQLGRVPLKQLPSVLGSGSETAPLPISTIVTTEAKSVNIVYPPVEQPANNLPTSSSSVPVPVPPASQKSPAPPVNTGTLRRSTPTAPLDTHIRIVSRGEMSSISTRPPAYTPSELQSQPASQVASMILDVSTRPSPREIVPVPYVTQAPLRPLSPIAPNDGGWAKVHGSDSDYEYPARPRRRDYDHDSPSPDSPGPGRYTSLEGSPFIPRSPMSAIGSPFPSEEQADRHFSPDQRDPSLPRNSGGHSTSSVSRHRVDSDGSTARQGRGSGRRTSSPERVVFESQSRSRSPPGIYGPRRVRLERNRRGDQGESISRNAIKNSMRASYSNSEHPVAAYNKALAPSSSSPTYNDSQTSLESRLTNGYYSSESFDSSNSSDEWSFENRKRSPPSYHQPRFSQPPHKRQKHMDTRDKSPVLLSRMADQPPPDSSSSFKGTARGHGGQAARGRGRFRGHGRGGASLNQRIQQTRNDSLLNRMHPQ